MTATFTPAPAHQSATAFGLALLMTLSVLVSLDALAVHEAADAAWALASPLLSALG